MFAMSILAQVLHEELGISLFPPALPSKGGEVME